MEADRAHYCLINPSQRSKRPQSPGSTSCDERNPMDSANWRSMEGSTAAVSTVPDMPPAVPTMGAPGSFSTHFKRAGWRPVWTRRNWYSRGVHWRKLQSGKKRGRFVGNTKRGKGTKIMAIADASGFPVAAHIESASPHEVKLVDKTIDNRFLEKLRW